MQSKSNVQEAIINMTKFKYLDAESVLENIIKKTS